MIERNLANTLREATSRYPVVTLTGPRQSGKTTLCRGLFSGHAYVSLEPLDVRSFAREDPRGFLQEYPGPAVIDEIQNAPGLLSYLQEEIDARPAPGRFVLTGSQNLMLFEAVSQSLAGRTSVLTLLPLSFDEIRRFENPPGDLWTTLWTGGYPRIYDMGIPAGQWLSDYTTTYVQRDLRSIANVGDLEAFTLFLRLAAARTATLVNFSAVGSDVGVSYNTIRAWLSILEAGFLCFRAPAWRTSLRKQLLKAPKLHFFDTGLVCHLLGITTPEQLRHHPLRGQIFESWVATEIYKYRSNKGLPANLRHFRDAKGLEIDLVVEGASGFAAVEAKSAATVSPSFYKPLKRFAASLPEPPASQLLIYGGNRRESRGDAAAVPWKKIHSVDWD